MTFLYSDVRNLSLTVVSFMTRPSWYVTHRRTQDLVTSAVVWLVTWSMCNTSNSYRWLLRWTRLRSFICWFVPAARCGKIKLQNKQVCISC